MITHLDALRSDDDTALTGGCASRCAQAGATTTQEEADRRRLTLRRGAVEPDAPLAVTVTAVGRGALPDALPDALLAPLPLPLPDALPERVVFAPNFVAASTRS